MNSTIQSFPRNHGSSFICDVLHHIEHRQVYLSRLRSCLKDKGRLAIIDYKANWPPGHEAMQYTVESLLSWMQEAGFRKSAEFELISDAFFLIFEPVKALVASMVALTLNGSVPSFRESTLAEG